MRKLFLVYLLENYSINKHDIYGVTFISLIYKYFKDTKEITFFQKLLGFEQHRQKYRFVSVTCE